MLGTAEDPDPLCVGMCIHTLTNYAAQTVHLFPLTKTCTR